MLPRPVVVHVSALVDLLLGTRHGNLVHGRLRGTRAHAPAHADAEALACLARLAALPAVVAEHAAGRLGSMPLVRHETEGLLTAAWARRWPLGPSDMLYVTLAERLDAPLVATDPRLAGHYPKADIIGR